MADEISELQENEEDEGIEMVRLRVVVPAEKLKLLRLAAAALDIDLGMVVNSAIFSMNCELDAQKIKPAMVKSQAINVSVMKCNVDDLRRHAKARNIKPQNLIADALDRLIDEKDLRGVRDNLNGVRQVIRDDQESARDESKDESSVNEATEASGEGWVKCRACNHQWKPRSPSSARCPRCQSREWNGVYSGKDRLHCNMCDHNWVPKGDGDPAVCPSCSSVNWMKPRDPNDTWVCPECGKWKPKYDRLDSIDFGITLCKKCNWKLKSRGETPSPLALDSDENDGGEK